MSIFSKKMQHLGIPRRCVQIVRMTGNNTLPALVVITRWATSIRTWSNALDTAMVPRERLVR